MVEARRQDVKYGRARVDELLQAFPQEGGPINGRQENGLHLVETELIRGLVGFN